LEREPRLTQSDDATKHTAIPSFPIVGVGASAGGLEAFREVLRFLPADTGMAYVLVQHLDPRHESLLPGLLARATHMKVHQARDGMAVEANQVYIIAPNTDLTLSQGVLQLVPRTETSGLHLSIDTFLRSLAESRTTGAMGVILSGTAADGTLGLQAIKAAGGMTFAQDPISAQFDGMPQSAIDSGSVDFIGSPEAIARELSRISRHPYIHQPPDAETEEDVTASGQAFHRPEPEFLQILWLLRRRTDTDFTVYKAATLERRIGRRMALLQIEQLAQYLTYLSDHQAEVEALYQDMLIGVTSFFRDPSTFQTLAQEIVPRLMAVKATGSPLRVWVPGCSTGEEVYSLAICLLEALGEHPLPTPPLQLFGTDLNTRAIEYARAGLYPPASISVLSPARLNHFFHSVKGSYQIHKAVRELCVFAQHNLLKDPPFSRLDLLSCQNVLIYLGLAAQKKVIQTFHYALAPHGVLLLGPSETIGTAVDLFAPVGENKRQWYAKKNSTVRPLVVRDTRSSIRGHTSSERGDTMAYAEEKREFDLQQETNRVLARFAPASVVIDAQMEILHFRGDTDPYLGPAPGRASLNLFKMARAGLDLELRTALSQARKSGQPVKKAGVQVNDHGVRRDITVEVIPLNASVSERYFVILFAETNAPSPEPTTLIAPGDAARRGTKDQRIQELERELEATREEMRKVIEELEAANEELHSANEESLSGNEELQSLNEELETSKEEIQASNEELLILNAELQQRNEQLHAAREYADAIVETIREPLLVLDADLRVQGANPAFYQFFQVEPAEIEHRRLFELEDSQWDVPALRTLLEELLPTNHSFTDYTMESTFPRIGHKTLLLNAHRIDHVPLILLAMEDITALTQAVKEKQQLLSQREEFMAIASHELKTPVTSLKGYIQLLHRRLHTAGDKQAASLLAKTDAGMNTLVTLINELLDVTAIEAGKLHWHSEVFDLDALVRDRVEDALQTTQQHQIYIEGTLSSPVLGNPERTSQVLINVLSNAIKYSPQAEAVKVSLRAEKDAAVVGVQDFGLGIAPEKQEHLFERFFRVSGPAHETFPGLGLGLYISAEIVKRQGGRMWVESQEGEGSTFFFTVPFAPETAAG